MVRSAGGSGSAISRISGAGLQADRLELQDCLYGSQGPVAAWAKTPNGQAIGNVAYFHGTNTNSDAGLKNAFQGRYHRLDFGDHNKTNKMMDSYPD